MLRFDAERLGLPSDIQGTAKIDVDARIAGLRRMREELARVVGCACDSLDHCTCGAAYLARRGRESSAPPTLLHVTNGESAGNSLRQTALGGAVLPWQDVLHDGPVPAVPRPEFLRVRAGFLSDCGWGSRRAILSSLERRDRQLVEALRGGSQVVLWFEHDLYDQLQLLDALALAHEAGASPELIVVDAFPGKPSFRGLGELTARRAGDAVAGAARGDRRRRSTRRRARGTPSVPPSRRRSQSGRRVGRASFRSSPRRCGDCSRSCRGRGRALGNRAACAAGDRGGREHSGGGVRRGAATRGRAVPRRCLVLSSARGARRRAGAPRRDRGGRSPAGTPAAQRRAGFRETAASADRGGTAGAPR